MKAVTRVGASICLTVFSLVSIILLLPSSRVGTQLQRIALGTTIDRLPDLWGWPSTKDGGIRVVVFGDSWVDDSQNGEKGKGRNWAEVLCEMINCTTHLNYAASQPLGSHPSSPPIGAITSNKIYMSALTSSSSSSPDTDTSGLKLLPDLETQVQQFIARTPKTSSPSETIFVLSFGFWDIYSYAALDYPVALEVTDKAVTEVFNQLETLYLHYSQSLSGAAASDATEPVQVTHAFRVVIPKLFDPTLLPGWISERPVPLAPSSIAEIQKNAAYLTIRWNLLLENKIGEWIKRVEPLPADTQIENNDANGSQGVERKPVIIEKDVFFYDLSKYLVDIILEHQLEDEGLTDATGLGTGQSPFESVYLPCVRAAEQGAEDGFIDLNGLLVCKEPEEYLFWDSFNLGCVANEAIGKEVGAMIREGKSMRQIWKEKGQKSR